MLVNYWDHEKEDKLCAYGFTVRMERIVGLRDKARGALSKSWCFIFTFLKQLKELPLPVAAAKPNFVFFCFPSSPNLLQLSLFWNPLLWEKQNHICTNKTTYCTDIFFHLRIIYIYIITCTCCERKDWINTAYNFNASSIL